MITVRNDLFSEFISLKYQLLFINIILVLFSGKYFWVKVIMFISGVSENTPSYLDLLKCRFIYQYNIWIFLVTHIIQIFMTVIIKMFKVGVLFFTSFRKRQDDNKTNDVTMIPQYINLLMRKKSKISLDLVGMQHHLKLATK